MILASLICLGAFLGLTAYVDHKQKRFIKELSVSAVNNYVNADHHWHDAGHFLFQFFIVTTIAAALPSNINYLAFLSTLLITYLLEFVLQIHPGQSHLDRLKEKDVQFDIATHVLGGLSALFLLF